MTAQLQSTDTGSECLLLALTGLLSHVVLATDVKQRWHAIHEAGVALFGATEHALLLNRGGRRSLTVLQATPAYTADASPVARAHIAARAVSQRGIVVRNRSDNALEIALPYCPRAVEGAPALAVSVFLLPPASAEDDAVVRKQAVQWLEAVWPLCLQTSLRQVAHYTGPDTSLDALLSSVLDTICDAIGFDFATISLIDAELDEVWTARGHGHHIQPNWVTDAHHALDSSDIQAYVVRTGETVLVYEWDDQRGRFTLDEKIWKIHHHERLVRVFIPIGYPDVVGTIEAGFPKKQFSFIPDHFIEALQRFVYLDLTPALRTALLQSRLDEMTNQLTSLHTLIMTEAQTPLDFTDIDTTSIFLASEIRLKRFAATARELLKADLVFVYVRTQMTRRSHDMLWFDDPVYDGELLSERPLDPVNLTPNIVHHIARAKAAYFAADATSDHILVPGSTDEDRTRSLTIQQKIASFVGVPLIVCGQIVGVLCLNYRERQTFTAAQRMMIELFAQDAANIIAGIDVVKEQERRRLASQLHDVVKTKAAGIALLAESTLRHLGGEHEAAIRYVKHMLQGSRDIVTCANRILVNMNVGDRDIPLDVTIAEEWESAFIGSDVRISPNIEQPVPLMKPQLGSEVTLILREIFTNIRKHVRARQVAVAVSNNDANFTIIVEDDGCGFDQSRYQLESGFGISYMEYRANQIGGHLTFEQLKSGGTRVRLNVPHSPSK